jgi:transmembrane sensor
MAQSAPTPNPPAVPGGRPGRRARVIGAGVVVAVAVTAGVAWNFLRDRPDTGVIEAPAGLPVAATEPRLVLLSDGSEVRLNGGGEIAELFTARERRLLVARGEAHVTVMKDNVRPFVVSVGTLRIRSAGSAFNVNLRPGRVDVLVTEGRIDVDRELVTPATKSAPAKTGVVPLTELSLGERIVLADPPPPGAAKAKLNVVRVRQADIAKLLAWQKDLMRLGGATLAEVIAEFERRTDLRVILGDPAMGQLRLGGRVRANDLDGFATYVAGALDLEAERAADGALVLRRKTFEPR